jgi:cysteine desulfurase
MQAIGKIKIDKSMWPGLSGYSLSAHKFHGPKGIGLLVYDSKLTLNPQLHGGKQQFGVRAGTLPVPLIMAFARIVELATARLQETERHLIKLHAYLVEGLKKINFKVLINSSSDDFQCPSIVNISLPPVEGEVMLHHLEKQEIYVGMGSACSANSKEPSKILMGIGLTEEQARCSLRISFSRNNNFDEIDKFLQVLKSSYQVLLSTFIKGTLDR